MDAKSIWIPTIERTNYSTTYKGMKRPQRKDYSSHAAYIAAIDKFNSSKPKRKDFKSHQEWVAATDKFNKASRSKKIVTKKPVVKSVNKTDYNVGTESGLKAYNKAVNNSKKNVNTSKPSNNSNKSTTKKVEKDKPANKLKIKPEKKVEKKDPLKDYRRGPGTKLGKDTRITKRLKKSGFTEDRLARLRKKNAEFKERRKKKKTFFRK